MNVYEKLQAATVRLQEMKIKKSGENKFSGFRYYELSDFLPEINRIFNDIKLRGIFSAEESKAQLRIVNSEKPEEFIAPSHAKRIKWKKEEGADLQTVS